MDLMRGKRRLGIVLLMLLAALMLSGLVQAQASDLFFSEYIEGSSNNKALEIYNGTGAAVDLAAGGYNIQMYFNGNPVASLTINLTGVVAAGDVYVVAHSSADATILAQADQTNGSGWFNGDDAVVLRQGSTFVDVIGQPGFDPGSQWGSGLVSTQDNTLRRKAEICAGDTDGTDAFDPAVEWDGFAQNTFDGLGSHTANCGTSTDPTPPTGIASANPAGVAPDEDTLLTVAVTLGTNPLSTGVMVTADLSALGGSATQSLYDDGSNGDVTVGDYVFTYLLHVPDGTAAGDYSLPVTVEDFQGRSSSTSLDLSIVALVAIHEIQGASHTSPLLNQTVTTEGVVTATSNNGFWFQSTTPDNDDATSEGLFVFTGGSPGVLPGEFVRVTGRVAEFRPGGSSTFNLTTTELTSPTVSLLSVGNPLPAATVIGFGGRIPPLSVINDDGSGNVEDQPPASFDANTDGIDFYESLEGMRVQVNNAVVVGATNRFNETWVLGDNGVGASGLTARGGILISPGDFNPERIQIDDSLYPGGSSAWPDVNVGTQITTPLVGVMEFNFGNFEVLVTDTYTVDTSSAVNREVTALAGSANELTVATFNVENLGGNAAAGDFASRAEQIVDNLGSPDIVVLEEIQDNDGSSNSGVTDASDTFNNLIAAIQTAGGPAYAFAQINPLDVTDGGQPGGNIRVGFLYNPARVDFVARPGGDATSANSVICDSGSPTLNFNPGRIDPTNIAFDDSRKPLAGQFEFNGEPIFVIGVHFNSKGGDTPLFGYLQPPDLVSEAQRLLQAQVVNNFADSILACDADASLIVLGDVNDFQFSPPVATLTGGVLHNLFDLLPANERYSYVFDGNSQVLDQMVVSSYLFNSASPVYDVVHVNAEFTDQVSDHDPSVAQFLPIIPVTLDVKPGSETNPINLKSNGKVPAAILGSADFDVSFVDPASLRLAGAALATKGRGSLMYSFEDVNSDGFQDMVLHFETSQLQLSGDETEILLEGNVFGGTKIRGVDNVELKGSNGIVLLAPANGAATSSNQPQFSWTSDAGNTTCYLIQIDTDPGFVVPVVEEATVVNSTQYTSFGLSSGTYYWRVQIGGTCGGVIAVPWSATWSINVP